MGRNFFSTGLYDKETVARRDVLFWGANHTEPSNRAGSEGLPRRVSPIWDSQTRTALHFGAPGARQGQVCDLTHGPGRSRSRLHPAPRTKCLGSDSDVVGVQRKQAPWDSCTPPMLSSPTLPSTQAGVCCIAPCTTCGSRGASKKKVWVHGLLQLQRVHPRLVGSSRENRNANFAFSQLACSESIK